MGFRVEPGAMRGQISVRGGWSNPLTVLTAQEKGAIEDPQPPVARIGQTSYIVLPPNSKGKISTLTTTSGGVGGVTIEEGPRLLGKNI